MDWKKISARCPMIEGYPYGGARKKAVVGALRLKRVKKIGGGSSVRGVSQS